MKHYLATLLLLAGLAAAHTADLEVDRIQVVTGPEGTFLELAVRYPKNDSPLSLRVVVTDRSRGVFERREGKAYHPVDALPIPYGISTFGTGTPYRIRLVGGRYRPGETVPVTLLFPAGALLTLPARVVSSPAHVPPAGLLALALPLFALILYRIRRRRGFRQPARAR